MAASVERTLNRWRSFGKLHFAVGRAATEASNTPFLHSSNTPPKDSSPFPVTFSGERLRNGMNGQMNFTKTNQLL